MDSIHETAERERERETKAIEAEDGWFLQTAKLLVTLNSGSIVALLAMSQALIANNHFHELKVFILVSLTAFLIGVICGVQAFRARRQAWSATIAQAVDTKARVLHSALSESMTATGCAFFFFVFGAISIGFGMASL